MPKIKVPKTQQQKKQQLRKENNRNRNSNKSNNSNNNNKHNPRVKVRAAMRLFHLIWFRFVLLRFHLILFTLALNIIVSKSGKSFVLLLIVGKSFVEQLLSLLKAQQWVTAARRGGLGDWVGQEGAANTDTRSQGSMTWAALVTCSSVSISLTLSLSSPYPICSSSSVPNAC